MMIEVAEETKVDDEDGRDENDKENIWFVVNRLWNQINWSCVRWNEQDLNTQQLTKWRRMRAFW
jgi:hypothetical protein